MSKRSPSPFGGGDDKRSRSSGGFSEVATMAFAAEVAAARASADQMLRQARGEPAGPAQSSKISDEAMQVIEVPFNKRLAKLLATPENREILSAESGAAVEWLSGSKARLVGSAKALNMARRSLSRVEMHCHWGASEDKVRRLLRRHQNAETVLCRLSPMTVAKLLPAEKTFSSKETVLTIGKDPKCDACVQDTAISRQHCTITFEPSKGTVFVTDLSTNGTYLNGIRLPSKKLGRVMLTHGDELLLRDPASGDSEFGYICNLTELSVRPQVKFTAPQRLLTSDEQRSGGDFR